MNVAAGGLLDPTHLVNTFGLIGLFVIIFAECGLLIGFFLPGDTLLFVAGVLVAQGVFNTPIWVLCVGVPIVATAGSLVGYWIGRKAGPALFNRPDSRFFKRRYVDQAHEFFERRGSFAIIAGRFIPVVRTFITVVAGVSRMDFARYALFSAGVSIVWGVGVPLAGYFLGNVPFFRDNVEVLAVLIGVVSIAPVVVELIRHRRKRRFETGTEPSA